MAKIATYTAEIQRLHPSDLGYTANIQLGRRLINFASDQASALKQGGVLAGQDILTQRKADVALQNFLDALNPPPATTRSSGGGGGGGGTLGRTASPREVARAAPALINALNNAVSPKADPGFDYTKNPRMHEVPRISDSPYDPVYGTPVGMGMEGPTNAGQDIFLPAGYQEQYGPPNPADVYGPPDPNAPAPPSTFQSWVNWVSGAMPDLSMPTLQPSEGVVPDYTSGGL